MIDLDDNFVCCGFLMPNFRSLVEHYEECHCSDNISNSDSAEVFEYAESISNDNTFDGPYVDFYPEMSVEAYNEMLLNFQLANNIPSLEGFMLTDFDAEAFDEAGLYTLPYTDQIGLLTADWNSQPESCGSIDMKVDQFDDSESADVEHDSDSDAVSPLASATLNSEEFLCPESKCGETFTNIYELNYHKNNDCPFRKTVDESKPYVCEKVGCYDSYKTLNGLKYHMTQNHNEIPFACLTSLNHNSTMDDFEYGTHVVSNEPVELIDAYDYMDFDEFELDDEFLPFLPENALTTSA